MLIDSEIIDDALLDIALVKENGEYENQLEVANRVRTEIAMDVVNIFGEVSPYEITINIFNQTFLFFQGFHQIIFYYKKTFPYFPFPTVLLYTNFDI